jgi:hypothetical protein
MFSTLHSFRPVLLLVILTLGLASCREKAAPQAGSADGRNVPPDRRAAECEFKRLQAELKLADSARTYLVIDLDQGRLLLKLKAAIVWETPLTLAENDSDRMYRFADRFLGEEGRTIRFVTEKYLFEAKGKSPDSVLTLVSKVLEVEADRLQRDIPGRFLVKWDKRLTLDVDTEVQGIPISRLKNTMLGVSEVISQPFDAQLDLKMHPDAALTFWHAVKEGMPTLLVPPR